MFLEKYGITMMDYYYSLLLLDNKNYSRIAFEIMYLNARRADQNELMLRAIENERLPEPDIELIQRVAKITEEEKLELFYTAYKKRSELDG